MTDNQIQTNFYSAPVAVGSADAKPNKAASSEFPSLFQNAVNAAGGQKSTDMDEIFERAANRYHVPANLLKAVAKTESGFDSDAVSSAGAQGVMQLMPSTAAGLGVTDPLDPEQNIMGGAKYLSEMLNRYDGDPTLALAAYNAGSGNVAKYGGVPPFKETQNYISRVMNYAGLSLDAPMTQPSDSLFGSSGSSGSMASLDMLNSLLNTSPSGDILSSLSTLLGSSYNNSTASTLNDLFGSSSSSEDNGVGGAAAGLNSGLGNLSSEDYLSLLQVMIGQMQSDSTQALASDLTDVLPSDSSDSSYGLLSL